MNNKQSLLANLYTFNIAAKSLSFTIAGEELFLTQGAISQRIKQLELQLGFTLFIRLTRKLELTEEGKRLWDVLDSSLETIFSEIEDIQFNELSGELYIGVAPTFAQSWLMPRLPEFQALYPSLDLKIRVKASPLDFKHEPVDLAIYYSNGQHPDLHCEKLFDEHLTPICTPHYAQKFTQHPFNMNNACLIHCTESLDSIRTDFEWTYWLSMTNKPTPTQMKNYVFNHSEMAISAVRNGMGIGIARTNLISTYLENGELITPFESIPSNLSYNLICPKGHEHRPKYQAFTRWLQRKIKEQG
ncbi:LysR substrate-binding domain-containing protein [Aliivibrio logei]|uniref:LysR substrate-binding domain-containing protein n=1 Tax=Aliivibrio logei TaxID=688 RepID=UPI0035C90BBE